MRRREFLKAVGAGAIGVMLPGCSDTLKNLFDDGSEQLWGMNVHPYSAGDKLDLQVKALRELSITDIRITLGIGQDLAAPYLRSYSANYLGLLADYNMSWVNSRTWPRVVRQVLGRGHRLAAIEILNEPGVFLGLSADAYVRDFLKPAWDIIKSAQPGLPVVAAAPQGTQDGVLYFYRMTDAGADSYCDFRAVHLYSDTPEQYLYGSHKPFMITETGVADPQRKVSWWKNEMPHMSGVLDTTRLYFYVLMDSPVSGHSVIEDQTDAQGNIIPRGPLYDYLKTTY